MIISASRRTDIPACQADWFLERLREGSVRVRNPVNPRQEREVSLRPDDVEGMVLWTKNPIPLMGRLDALREYAYYVQFTLTPYGRDIEAHLPDKGELVEAFCRLSDRLGPERVLWRYDPILLTPQCTLAYHEDRFEAMARKLAGRTAQCTISFLDMYPRIRSAMRSIQASAPGEEKMRWLARSLSQIAAGYRLKLVSCAETIDLDEFGIDHACCVDAERLSRLSGQSIRAVRDRNQRPACGCAQSLDIGTYDTCQNGCRYCYACRSQGKEPPAPAGNPAGVRRQGAGTEKDGSSAAHLA